MTPEELRAWRTSQGLSQRQLADKLGVTRNAVSFWETGERPIPSYLHLALKSLTQRKRASKTP